MLSIFLTVPLVGTGLLVGIIARKHGYNALLWVFTGPLGLLLMFFFADTIHTDKPAEEMVRLRKTGNLVAGIISGFNLFTLGVYILIFFLLRSHLH